MTHRSALAVAGQTRQQMWGMAIALLGVIALATVWGLSMGWSWEPLPTSTPEPERWHAVPIQLAIIAVSVGLGSIVSSLLFGRRLPSLSLSRRDDPPTLSQLPWRLAFLSAWMFALSMATSAPWVGYGTTGTILVPERTALPMLFTAIVYTDIANAIQLVAGVLGWVLGFGVGILVNALRTDRRLPEPSPVRSREAAPAE